MSARLLRGAKGRPPPSGDGLRRKAMFREPSSAPHPEGHGKLGMECAGSWNRPLPRSNLRNGCTIADCIKCSRSCRARMNRLCSCSGTIRASACSHRSSSGKNRSILSSEGIRPQRHWYATCLRTAGNPHATDQDPPWISLCLATLNETRVAAVRGAKAQVQLFRIWLKKSFVRSF